jgi:uridylate kinase
MWDMKKTRVLLKISGEALQWKYEYGIDFHYVQEVATEVARIQETWVEIVIVLWGGNIFRWIPAAENGMNRVKADYMWLMATIMNGVAFQDALEKAWVDSVLMSALDIPHIAEYYIARQAQKHLKKGRIVVSVGGSGNPYFTTDSAWVLRALELNCDMMIKATKVDGVYTKDPKKHPDAELIEHATYQDVIHKDIRVMDHTAITLAKEGEMVLKVVNLHKKWAIMRAIEGKKEGTTISRKM